MRNYLLKFYLFLALLYGGISLQAGIWDVNEIEAGVDSYGKSVTGSVLFYKEGGNEVYTYDIHSFPLSSDNGVAEVTPVISADWGIFDGVLIDDIYYASGFYSEPNEGRQTNGIYTYNVNTWEFIERLFVTDNTALPSLAYDIQEDQLYGISRSPKYLYKVNYRNGEAVELASLEEEIVSATFDNRGQLHVIDSEANFYKLDKKTGESTLIGSTGLTLGTGVYFGFFYDEDADKFYWSPNLPNSSGLYEIDRTTGRATLAMSFPRQESFVGTILTHNPNPQAAKGVSDLIFIPDSPAGRSGRVRFTVPQETEGGETLSSKLSGTLYVDHNIEIPLTDLTPGNTYFSIPIDLDREGLIVFRIALFNENGESRKIVHRIWVGKDKPAPVSDFTLTKNEEGKAQLNWEGVFVGDHNGYIDVSSIKYKITRFPDNVEVVSGLTETTYIDDSIEGFLDIYSYSIVAYYESLEGEPSFSNELALGVPFTLPFEQELTERNFGFWELLDVNGDGDTWDYISGAVFSPSLQRRPSDDWMFSPAIDLEGGLYKLSFLMTTPSIYAKGNFKITYGSTLNPDDHTLIKEYIEFVNVEDKIEEIEFFLPASEAGTYHLALHCYTPQTGGLVAIRMIRLEMAASAGSPGTVTDLSISYGSKGSAPALLSFVAPALTTSNEDLEEIDQIEIYRNVYDTPVHIISPVEKSKLYEWTDEGVSAGSNYYRIRGVNSEGSGMVAMDSVYIGLDLPGAVGNLALTRNDQDNASLSWEAPVEGMHKGYIADDFVYKVLRSDGSKEEVVASALTSTNYTDNTVSKVEQNLYSYTVVPYYPPTLDSEGQSTQSNIVRFGFAYDLPYTESFANSKATKPGWSIDILSGDDDIWSLSATLSGTDFTPQDGDKGMAVVVMEDVSRNSKSRFISPILDISTIDDPLLRFWFTHYEVNSANEYLLLSVSTDNGNSFETLAMDTIFPSISQNKTKVFAGWNLYEFSLEKYKEASEIMIGFDAGLNGTGDYSMAIDNIAVIDRPNKDLKVVSFELPSRLLAGYSNEFEVTLKNSGKQAASDYKVSLYKGSEKIGEFSGNSINSDEVVELPISASFDLSEIGKTYSFHVEVNFAGDEFEDDNLSQNISGIVERSVYSGVSELRGIQEEGQVLLEWDTPVNPKNPVLIEEGFEEYEAFIIDGIGEWTVIDEDKENTLVLGNEIFNIWNYKNVGSPMAYQVFNAYSVAPKYDDWNPHSGQQLLISMVHIKVGANDDWLISPELNGSAQEITFYARGANTNTTNPERFVVYASSTGKEISDFSSLIDGAFQEAATSWTQYRYTLPEGSRYFAIRCVSENALTFLLDDICFAKGGDALTVSGYNVYRNDVKLNTSILPVGTTEYVDESPIDGGKTYTVTAVYSSGESNYSNELRFDYVGISDDVLDSILVYSPVAGEIIIEGAEYLMIQIIGIDGSLVHRSLGSGFDKISLLSGSYIVKVGQKVTKVIVK